MAEDVDEEESLGFEPGGDFFEEVRVGFHVLEHFDGEDVSEPGESQPGEAGLEAQ